MRKPGIEVNAGKKETVRIRKHGIDVNASKEERLNSLSVFIRYFYFGHPHIRMKAHTPHHPLSVISNLSLCL
ncbi:hypothetical protein L2E82_16476 [Cichorium intybus]|uniref:Uncharacterized protein n=1 Tax=Cichorium intybus TaxID=13427 RepID=A0ACB9F551_CICIN|nr:hypothetical protein L2E82_16476 [Cichorium intybus]